MLWTDKVPTSGTIINSTVYPVYNDRVNRFFIHTTSLLSQHCPKQRNQKRRSMFDRLSLACSIFINAAMTAVRRASAVRKATTLRDRTVMPATFCKSWICNLSEADPDCRFSDQISRQRHLPQPGRAPGHPDASTCRGLNFGASA